MDVSCIHLAAAFASLMFILFLSYGETTGGGVPSDAVTAHQEGYGAKKPEGEEKEDVESPELAATELAEEDEGAEEPNVAAKDAEREREANWEKMMRGDEHKLLPGGNGVTWGLQARETVSRMRTAKPLAAQGRVPTVAKTIFEQAIRHAVIISGDAVTMGDEIWMIEGILKTRPKIKDTVNRLLLINVDSKEYMELFETIW